MYIDFQRDTNQNFENFLKCLNDVAKNQMFDAIDERMRTEMCLLTTLW